MSSSSEGGMLMLSDINCALIDDSDNNVSTRTSSANSSNHNYNETLYRNESSSSSSSSMFGSFRSYNKWSPTEEGITLAWKDLNIYRKEKNKENYHRIINGISGAVKPGSLVALMGTSGTGKSTLMSTLAYRTSDVIKVDGDILINGRPIGNYMRYLSGFMHQNELFVESLTVWEHMNFMARFKCDRRKSKEEREDKILKLLKRLNLNKCIHNKIGGSNGDNKILSGGELKRLAFATELLTDPLILFCDEPTTGLDSTSASNILDVMNSLTSSGKTIICTIHQPSSQFFFMFNQVIFLSDGKIAFAGSTSGALDFFKELGYECPENYNPADFFIRTLAITPGLEDESKQTIKYICNQYLVSSYSKQIDVIIQYEFHMGRSLETSDYVLKKDLEIFWWTKLWMLIYRNILDILRNPSIQFIKIIQKIIVAFLVGLCYSGSLSLNQAGIMTTQGSIVAMVCENVFSPMYGVLATFPNDLTLFTREHKSGLYSSGIFYLAKLIASVPGFLIDPIIFTSICYWLIGYKSNAYEFWMTTLTLTLTFNVSTACGFFFSNLFDSIPKAMAILVPFDYVLMITSGFFINIGTLPKLISWSKYLSWLLYSTETMSILQWHGVHNITCEIKEEGYPCITDGVDVLKKYNFSEDRVTIDLLSMVVLLITFHLLGFLSLWWKTKKRNGH